MAYLILYFTTYHYVKSYKIEGNYPDGYGKLDFSSTIQTNNHGICIRSIESILNLPFPDIIESKFDSGIVDGIVNLTWLERNLRMSAYSENGKLHGMFKVYDGRNEKWMIGSFVQNKLQNEPCWIISQQMVSF